MTAVDLEGRGGIILWVPATLSPHALVQQATKELKGGNLSQSRHCEALRGA